MRAPTGSSGHPSETVGEGNLAFLISNLDGKEIQGIRPVRCPIAPLSIGLRRTSFPSTDSPVPLCGMDNT
jgi:hypothetical protein